eukprot:INCI12168.1.p1 GENE.INCI12168.1~~INCI12168.1.p1  ORF type:complete len:231 (-),score=72.41 INCI12168.1:477-1169(-)
MDEQDRRLALAGGERQTRGASSAELDAAKKDLDSELQAKADTMVVDNARFIARQEMQTMQLNYKQLQQELSAAQEQKHKVEARLNVTNENFTELQLKTQASDLQAKSRIAELESAVRDLTAQVSSIRAENDMLKRRTVDLETEQVDKQKKFADSISSIQSEHARQMHMNSTNHLKQLKDADERHFKELQQAKTAHQSDVAIANKERRQEVHQKRTGFCCVANFLQKHAPN